MKKPSSLVLLSLATVLGLAGLWYLRSRPVLEPQERRAERRAIGPKTPYDTCTGTDQLDQYCAGSRALGVSANGQFVATSGSEVAVWNVATGKAAWRVPAVGNVYAPQSVLLVANDGQHVVCAELSKQATWFDASGKYGVFDDCGAPWPRPSTVALSPDGKLLLMGEKACLHSLDNPGQGVELPIACRPNQAAFTPDGKQLWLACEHSLKRFDVAAGKEIPAPAAVTEGDPQSAPSYFGAYVPTKGARLLTLSDPGCVVGEWTQADTKLTRSSAWSCNRYQAPIWSDTFVVVGKADSSTFFFFDLERRALAPQALPGHGSRRLAMSRDGQVVFIAQVSANIQEPAPTVFRFRPLPAP